PLLPPPSATPFPYTTLFRSHRQRIPGGGGRKRPASAPVAGTLDCFSSVDPGSRRHEAGFATRVRIGLLFPASRSFTSLRSCHERDRKSTRLNSSHVKSSYAV